MGSAACPGDDCTQTALHRLLCVSKHRIGHAVRRNDARLMRDRKLLEDLSRVLHGVPVA